MKMFDQFSSKNKKLKIINLQRSTKPKFPMNNKKVKKSERNITSHDKKQE